MRSLALSLTVALGVVAGMLSPNFGCSEVDAAFDCNQVCNRYKTCFNQNYDVSACTSRCRTMASNDATFKDKADACESCIDDMSCASATFSCGIQCAGVVGP